MESTEQTKRDILDSLLTTIEHISDKNYQQRVWIQGDGPEVDDFDETLCHFFHEGDGIIEKAENFKLTENQLCLLKQFRKEFKQFSHNNRLPQLFINTLEWTRITLMAKDVLRAFGRYLDRKYILNEYLGNIAHISDKDYQRRIWIRGEGPECDDFDETVCYHSSITNCIFKEYEAYGVSDTQLELLKKFDEEFQKFWGDNDFPHLFIDTPEWTQITLLAKEVLRAFGKECN